VSGRSFLDLLEEEAAAMLAGGWTADWVIGAINPREMAFFLATCRAAGVERVIESGRQDGYSTRILGAFAARRPGVEALSIDMEIDTERARACRARLADLPVELLRADAYLAVGREVAASTKPTALLINGPKGFPAIAMLLAAGRLAHVRVLALHNLGVETPWLPYFRTLGDTARLFEDVPGTAALPAWNALGGAETAHFLRLLGVEAMRGESTLGVMTLPPATPLPAFGKRFGFHQPALLAALWKLGLSGVARRLFVASFHLFGNK
jgi:hypothetical protein